MTCLDGRLDQVIGPVQVVRVIYLRARVSVGAARASLVIQTRAHRLAVPLWRELLSTCWKCAAPRYPHPEGEDEEDEANPCAICLTNKRAVAGKCGHASHAVRT